MSQTVAEHRQQTAASNNYVDANKVDYKAFFADKNNHGKMLRIPNNQHIMGSAYELDYGQLANQISNSRRSFSIILLLFIGFLIYLFRRRVHIAGCHVKDNLLNFKNAKPSLAGLGELLSPKNNYQKLNQDDDLSFKNQQPTNKLGYPMINKNSHKSQQHIQGMRGEENLPDGDPNDHSEGFKFQKGGKFNRPMGRYELSASSSEWESDENPASRSFKNAKSSPRSSKKSAKSHNPYMDSPEETQSSSEEDAKVNQHGRVLYHDDPRIKLKMPNNGLGYASSLKNKISSTLKGKISKMGTTQKVPVKSNRKSAGELFQEAFQMSSARSSSTNPNSSMASPGEPNHLNLPSPNSSTSKNNVPYGADTGIEDDGLPPPVAKDELYDPYEEDYDPNYHPDIDRTELFSHSIADKSLGSKSKIKNKKSIDGEEPDKSFLL